MTQEIWLYLIFAAMLVVAVAFVVPSLLAGMRGQKEDDRVVHERALGRALAYEYDTLLASREAGEIDQATYEAMLDDLEHRAVEEAKTTPAESAPARHVNIPVVTAAVVAVMVFVSAGTYMLVGTPDMIELGTGQKVMEGTADAGQIRTYLKSNPRDGRAWVLLARRLADQDNFAEAADAYRQARSAMTKVRNDPTVSLEYAACLMSLQTPQAYREAEPLLKEAHEAMPENKSVSELYALACSSLGKWKEAAAAIRSMMVGMSPDTGLYMQYSEMARRLEATAAREDEAARAKEAAASAVTGQKIK